MNTHFNPVSGAVFSGRNLESLESAVAEHDYESTKWITYFQAKTLDILDGVTLKGRAVGMVRFGKDANGKSTAIWYNVFNTDLFPNLPTKGLKKANKVAKKAAKAAPKKAAKAAPKKASKKAALSVPTMSVAPAIPVQGKEGYFLVCNDGVYTEIHVGS